MTFIETHELKNSTIMWIYSERGEIETSPEYQRMGGVWTLEKRRLLIDSIINNYDLPKIYFHEFSRARALESGHKYAIIDGRQRLETIWQFVDDELSLADDIVIQRFPEATLGGLRYSDIAKEYPKLRIQFDSFVLPIITVRTENDDVEIIEDMFSRLNEAVPLNAAEKRNAIGGNFVKAIRRVSGHEFFTDRIRIPNSRYQHREVAARMLLTEFNVAKHGRVIDTKKVWLDQMAKNFKSSNKNEVREMETGVRLVLDAMLQVFHQQDDLLRAQGVLIVYFLIFREAVRRDGFSILTRQALLEFRREVAKNRKMAEADYVSAKFELLEFDRLNQQGTNDASSITTRVKILQDFLKAAAKPRNSSV